MKITAVFALTLLTSLMLAFAQATDEANAAPPEDRASLARAYLRADVHLTAL
jgi:hypothetical protein